MSTEPQAADVEVVPTGSPAADCHIIPIGSPAQSTNFRDHMIAIGVAALGSLGVIGDSIIQTVAPLFRNSTLTGVLIAMLLTYIGSILIRWARDNSHEATVLPVDYGRSQFPPYGQYSPQPAPYMPGQPDPNLTQQGYPQPQQPGYNPQPQVYVPPPP